MKAILHTKYGSPNELQLKEVEKPFPKDNEVLIKIHATTVTTSDCNVRNFTFVPKSFMFFARIMLGFKKPKINILGIDLAGEIEAVGKNVKRFRTGDQVFGSPGTKMGAHAEYTCMSEDGASFSPSCRETASSVGNRAAFHRSRASLPPECRAPDKTPGAAHNERTPPVPNRERIATPAPADEK